MTSVSEIMDSMEYGPASEDASAVRAWLEQRGEFGHFIAGKFTAPGDLFTVSDPASGTDLARVSQGSGADIDAAVKAARKAQPGWAALSGHQRARFLYAMARHLQKHERFFSVLESLNNGKPLRESRDVDVPLAIRHFYHHAGWAELAQSEFADYQPLGVCGQVIPWNFPLLMLAWKIAPALVAGNTVVLKPAEYTPLTALAFAELCQNIGLPAGVVNIVTGDGLTGQALVGAAVDKIAFTGSTSVGQQIAREVAGSGKRLTLELGGKSPFIVMEDADLDAAVEGVVDSIWFNQGEVCCAGSRILVAEAVVSRFETLLKRRMKTLRLGPPLDKSTDIGAMIHPRQKQKVLELCAQAVAEGAELVGGEAQKGCFIAPGYLRAIAPTNIAMQAEIFGPIATLSTFRTADEAVDLANNTRYGLAASIWSESSAVALDLAQRVKAGVVWINTANQFDAAAPFGGIRDSGYGREGGRIGMLDYLRAPMGQAAGKPAKTASAKGAQAQGIDRTVKLYIGGAQKRPDGGASHDAQGQQIPSGGRKDIRNAVEAAHAARGKWLGLGAHGRAQVLYFLSENLDQRRAEFRQFASEDEIEAAIARCFFYAAFADKFDGSVPAAKAGHLVLVQPEPQGVIGMTAPDASPLLGLMSLALPAIAAGNCVIVVPSERQPMAAMSLAQVMAYSDLPGGVVNIISGSAEALAGAMALHDDVQALWLADQPAWAGMVQDAASATLKPVWLPEVINWQDAQAQGRVFLAQASRAKTIWLPYGALPAGTGSAPY